MFPIHRPKAHPSIPAHRISTTHHFLMLLCVTNIGLLIVVANLAKEVTEALQR